MRPVSAAHDIGIVVGRFQVHDLHEGHRDLIQYACDQHSKVLVVLGRSAVPTSQRDPLPYEAREQMIRAAFPKVSIMPVNDSHSDAQWSRNLDERINDFVVPGQSAVIYGSRDSFVDHYTGRHATIELEGAGAFSGTLARHAVAKAATVDSPDFRAGVIWATHARYPTAYCTVDAAVFDGQGKILMARKPAEDKIRFIGGFSDPGSPDLESDVRREVAEESTVSVDDVRYVGSLVVDDWRYKQGMDKIKTVLFTAKYQFGKPSASDDLSGGWCGWLDFSLLTCDDVEPVHVPVFEMLTEHLKKETS